MRVTLLVGLLILLAGCAAKPAAVVQPPPPPPAPGSLVIPREFVDLMPGWRLQIVAPVTKSGSYIVKTEASQPQGSSISMKACDDMIGYATASWGLLARPGGGVSIQLTSAEMVKDGQPAPIAAPTRALIHTPKYARFLRVFYLTRKSASDHDMAILGAGRIEQLGPLTDRLRANPSEACVDRPHDRIYCEWIPVGMAVRPEMQKVVNGETRWVNAF